MGSYRYFNDNNALLRIGPEESVEQFMPEGAEWSPGGMPSYRSAWLSYEQAQKMAEHLVLAFGDKEALDLLDIGEEKYDDKEYRFYFDTNREVLRRVGKDMTTEEFISEVKEWRRCHIPTYRSVRVSYEKAKEIAGEDLGPKKLSYPKKVKKTLSDIAHAPQKLLESGSAGFSGSAAEETE